MIPSFPVLTLGTPNVEICFNFDPDAPVINNFNELNEDECFDPEGGEIDFSLNVEDDDSFTFFIWTFLPFLTYSADSPLLLSTGSEDTIFDPGISTGSEDTIFDPGISTSVASHRDGTFMCFNESPIEIFFSICSPMDNLIRGRDVPDFEDSRAHGFVHSYIRASYPQLHLENPIS
ncbi:hypothetical protein Tco_0318860 [Tanacetum coccineum]